ncbi:MAG: nicotinamide riboside transporter PnuC [Rikenellaceae bacterium]|nr:nicotinamide riboside transporter PnuC [Rikenellaceae bacterium]
MLWLEITGAVVGLLYIWLEYRASVWLWLTGIVMPAIYIYVYYASGFYADMGINVYFLAAGLYGWAYWLGRTRRRNKAEDKSQLSVSHTPAKYWLPAAVVTTVVFAVILFVLKRYTDSDVPYGDSFTTALSVAGLWLLTRKYVEQWLVWIVVDMVSAGLYFYKGLLPTAILYTLYMVIAVFGYYRWRKLAEQTKYE